MWRLAVSAAEESDVGKPVAAKVIVPVSVWVALGYQQLACLRLIAAVQGLPPESELLFGA
jgi:hypothetical protein